MLSGSVEMDEVKLNFIVVFCSPFFSVFQGENFTVADEYMLTREEFCSKTEKENFCQQPLCWEHRTMEKRKPWLSV